jgi:LytS/YehU family sensor histidine kinase
MLEEVRRAYEHDAARAERLLDELVAFLRVALPRLRSPWSSVQREALLARSYAQLRNVAGASEIEMLVDVPAEASDARFPPGVLLPLLDEALRAHGGTCSLNARRCTGNCEVVLALPARPRDAAVARVRSLLADLYGTSAELSIMQVNCVATATVRVPYETN